MDYNQRGIDLGNEMAGDQHRSVVVWCVEVASVLLGKKKRDRLSSGKLATTFLLPNSSHCCHGCTDTHQVSGKYLELDLELLTR